ncbi:type IV pilus secretin PilQ [Dokdonella sp.]|uniref:type IV pilus secretin PilQ n=1 Tax=Dokdonella sp. TaxID=2291710 RepID=UPI0037840BB6
MTTTFAATSERKFAFRAVRSHLLGILAFVGLVLGASAHAESVLEDIAYTALPGGKVEVTLKFTGPAIAPQVFSTENPPSIALDFADTRNAFSKRKVDVGAGAVSAVSAIEAAGRTRVVADLFRMAGYDTRVNGNNVVLSINNGIVGSSTVAASAAKADPTKAVGGGQNVELSNVDFRRGKNGEGRVVVSFSGPGASANLRREGNNIVLDLLNVKLAASQAQHLDVLDFATPVQSIDTRVRGAGVHMEIVAKQPYEQLAYQSGNEYVVEVAPKKEEKLKGKNAEPDYNGSRVTFNFQDIPTRSVLQLIADVSDLNIVVSDSVQGNVTLRLINVPWDQALDIVLQAKGLDKRRRGNVIWVAPQKEIADREEAIADARLKMEDKDELITDYIPVSYGKAKDIAALLTKDTQTNSAGGTATTGSQVQRGFLSSRGSVTFDDRTNTLLVSDIPSKVQEIRQLIAVLDRPVQQVLIESRIVIATDSFARELGVKFGVTGARRDSNGNVVASSGNSLGADYMIDQAFAGRLTPGGTPYPIFPPGLNGGRVTQEGNVLNNRYNVNMPVTNPAGSLGLAILGADYLLDLELSAAQTEGRGEVISSPRVITANQQEADIKQGQEIGYVTISAGSGGGIGTPTVNFKDVVLELKVTPTITADDRVVLNLNVKKDNVAGFVDSPGGGQVPTIDKREISTEVLVDNGQTVVLGGVYEVSKSETQKKVPMLGDIPILGNLFKNRGRQDNKAELLIFVTPRILSDNLK